ncbi:MAG: DNA polymerase III subunit delta [Gammaproteobacteria bacterium]|nr:DNA polymerase III subunit delta [Gammaproteobacteria bacterium]
MRIQHNQLPAHLGKQLAPLYHLFGAEQLLIEEALDQIRARAREVGFTERIRHTLEPGFDWNEALAGARAMSLFAEKKIIEVRMPAGRPGEAGAKALVRHAAETPSDDCVLLLAGGAADRATQKTKWFTAVEAAGVAVECAAIPPAHLPEWVSRRMASRGLQCERDAAARLAQLVEGNLLAAAQAVDLLALLSPKEAVTCDAVESAVADHARFNVFAFADACLAGSAPRCTRILQSLRREQAEPTLILWALAREARTLCQLSAGLARGGNRQGLFKRHGVWSSRAGAVGAALDRLSAPQCENLLRRLARADLMLKGRAPLQRRDIWEEIESIGLRMCGLAIP